METDLTIDDASVPGFATIRAENVGGIDETEVSLERGVTVLSGRNATNRTSLLKAIMAALGSDTTSLKADADEGVAVLEFGDETYRRTLRRRNGTVVADGDPYLDDPEMADLFAFLLESNAVRRAVARGEDLRELLMRPVDTDEIQREIERNTRRKQRIDERLAELEDLETRLPELERKRTRLTDEIATLQSELEAAEAELDGASADVDGTREGPTELEEKLDELRAVRSELARTRDRIETERASIDALEDEREDLTGVDALDGSDEVDRDRLEAEIAALQDEREALEDQISQFQSTIQFNERLLEEPDAFLDADAAADDPTAELVPEAEEVACWTCGSTVPRTQIETTIEQLRTARRDRLDERNELAAELEERREILERIERRRSEHRRATRRRDEIDDEIERRTERLEDLTGDRDRLMDAVSELEAEIESLESDAYDEVLDQHREVNEIEFELERTEDERAEVDDRIASIEDRLDERADLEERREEVTDTLTELRTRIERIEADAVDAFNEHMANVLDVLEYDNLDRIWIDRSSRDVQDGRRTVTRSRFDLKIVRTTADGTAYEDVIGNLSESEREVTGLVFALAGYLVHEVYETVPFMLLDSLEAVDADRIADLVAYFRKYAPYIVVALLEEDAAALDDEYAYASEI